MLSGGVAGAFLGLLLTGLSVLGPAISSACGHLLLQEESVNTARPLEEGHVQRQARWKKTESKDLLAMH